MTLSPELASWAKISQAGLDAGELRTDWLAALAGRDVIAHQERLDAVARDAAGQVKAARDLAENVEELAAELAASEATARKRSGEAQQAHGKAAAAYEAARKDGSPAAQTASRERLEGHLKTWEDRQGVAEIARQAAAQARQDLAAARQALAVAEDLAATAAEAAASPGRVPLSDDTIDAAALQLAEDWQHWDLTYDDWGRIAHHLRWFLHNELPRLRTLAGMTFRPGDDPDPVPQLVHVDGMGIRR